VDYVTEVTADRDALETSLATIEARFVQVRAQLDGEGLVVAGSKGQPRPSPMTAVERALVRDAVRIRRQLDTLRMRRPGAALYGRCIVPPG
jgi:hypothetical protein